MSDGRAVVPPSRAVAELAGRLAAEGRLRGVRLADGKAAGSGALGDLVVRGVTHDSRAVVVGGLFVAIQGDRVDGHDFAAAAVASGAAVLIVERPLPAVAAAQLVVDAARPSLAQAAADRKSVV